MSVNNYNEISNQIDKINFESTIRKYVDLMKQTNISRIVDMNIYISNNNLWAQFSEIQTFNTYNSGFKSVGISKKAYIAIRDLYETTDIIKSHLVDSIKMHQKTINFDDWEYR